MQVIEQWAGHYASPAENSDKIWAGCCLDTGDYLATWGRRGRRQYQSQVKHLGSAELARQEFGRMVREKQRKGYRAVPFEDSRYGNIPAFSPSGPASQPLPGDQSQLITPQYLAGRLAALSNRLSLGTDSDRALLEYRQLSATARLILEYAAVMEATGREKLTVVDSLASLENLSLVLERLDWQVRETLLNGNF